MATIAGSLQGYVDGYGNSARFFGPKGLELDTAGNLFVAERNGNNIRKLTFSGLFAESNVFFSLPVFISFVSFLYIFLWCQIHVLSESTDINSAIRHHKVPPYPIIRSHLLFCYPWFLFQVISCTIRMFTHVHSIQMHFPSLDR